jgi:hypothetical protein
VVVTGGTSAWPLSVATNDVSGSVVSEQAANTRSVASAPALAALRLKQRIESSLLKGEAGCLPV